MSVPATQQQQPRPGVVAGGPVAALVPQSLEEAFRVASAIAASGLAPRGLDKPEQVMVAIMAGAELGLAPFQALQSFAVVNGRPTLWGDGLVAVARAQGVKVRETMDGDGDGMVATCTVTRPDTGEEITRTFSVADAKKASLWGKQGPWQSYPKRMLAMRARAWALRDGCADFLRGFQVREEVEDYQPIRDVTPAAPPPGLAARLAAAPAATEGFNAREEQPAHDAETGEVIEAEVEAVEAAEEPAVGQDVAEVSPADPEPGLPGLKSGADLAAEQQAAKPPLAQRIAGWKANCERATSTAKLRDLWARSSELRNDIDAADPDEHGTVDHLQHWWQAIYDAAEAKEREAQS